MTPWVSYHSHAANQLSSKTFQILNRQKMQLKLNFCMRKCKIYSRIQLNIWIKSNKNSVTCSFYQKFHSHYNKVKIIFKLLATKVGKLQQCLSDLTLSTKHFSFQNLWKNDDIRLVKRAAIVILCSHSPSLFLMPSNAFIKIPEVNLKV